MERQQGENLMMINRSLLVIFCALRVILTLPLFFGTSYVLAQERIAAPWVGETLWGAPCASLAREQGYGPFDYLLRQSLQFELNIVEKAHFSAESERLMGKGMQGTGPWGDLDYTLRAWPNHHRALNTAIKLRMQYDESSFYYSNHLPPAECYFERATHYSSKDGTSFMLFGMLLHKLNHLGLAYQKYNIAEQLQPRDDNLKYNIGLLLVDMGRLDEARVYADEVYARGFPFPGLKRKLSVDN
jgi:hypothetical protein